MTASSVKINTVAKEWTTALRQKQIHCFKGWIDAIRVVK